MPTRAPETEKTRELRARLAGLRRELDTAMEAYRQAAARGDSQSVIPLLRSRSRLMRQLLDAQSELLLFLRADASRPATPLAEKSVEPVEAPGSVLA